MTLLLLLQIGTLGMGMAPAQNKPPVMIMDVEVLEPLRSAIRDQLRDGHVRTLKYKLVSQRRRTRTRSGEGRTLGVPRLVESTEGTVITLSLIQTYLPTHRAQQTEFTVEKFNLLAFRLRLTYVLWETSSDTATGCYYEYIVGECRISDLVYEFLREYGETPKITPHAEWDWASRCDPTHKLGRDWVIKVGYENRNRIALPRTAHCKGHDS